MKLRDKNSTCISVDKVSMMHLPEIADSSSSHIPLYLTIDRESVAINYYSVESRREDYDKIEKVMR